MLLYPLRMCMRVDGYLWICMIYALLVCLYINLCISLHVECEKYNWISKTVYICINSWTPTFLQKYMVFKSSDNYGTSFFCRMRMYHGLKSSGFGVRNKRTIYKPCKIILKFHDPSCMEETASTYGPNSSLLLAEVIPIESVYHG